MEKVYETTDYNMFRTLDGNRLVRDSHVRNLVDAIRKNDMKLPLIVNKKMEILDGQHTLAAKKLLKKVVQYIIRERLGIKEVRKVTLNPIVIIQPKSITGFMPLNTRDVKAQIVVNAVYKQGHTIFFVVKNTISLCSLFGISLQSCLYRTAKWIFIAIVKINIKEIKLDDITVTSQFINPRIPIIIKTA